MENDTTTNVPGWSGETWEWWKRWAVWAVVQVYVHRETFEVCWRLPTEPEFYDVGLAPPDELDDEPGDPTRPTGRLGRVVHQPRWARRRRRREGPVWGMVTTTVPCLAFYRGAVMVGVAWGDTPEDAWSRGIQLGDGRVVPLSALVERYGGELPTPEELEARLEAANTFRPQVLATVGDGPDGGYVQSADGIDERPMPSAVQRMLEQLARGPVEPFAEFQIPRDPFEPGADYVSIEGTDSLVSAGSEARLSWEAHDDGIIRGFLVTTADPTAALAPEDAASRVSVVRITVGPDVVQDGPVPASMYAMLTGKQKLAIDVKRGQRISFDVETSIDAIVYVSALREGRSKR